MIDIAVMVGLLILALVGFNVEVSDSPTEPIGALDMLRIVIACMAIGFLASRLTTSPGLLPGGGSDQLHNRSGLLSPTP